MSESLDHADLLQRSLVALDEMEARLAASEHRRHEPIAIVGMGLRFPGGADGVEEFWDLLVAGRDGVTEIPADRWDVDAMFDPDPEAHGKSYTRWGGFLHDVDRFDAPFFGISPREAVSMDPQQRILLEVAWEAIEDAGIPVSDLAGTRTGVFVGVIGTEYSGLALRGGVMDDVDAYFASGVAHSIAAGRLAYTLDLRGPAVSVDTACSSSLLSTHLACQSLRTGESDIALAGGVNLMLSPDAHVMTSQARMMSFEGRCKTFDAAADGYVRSEGCAFVVLKRLSDAVAAGDHIMACIRGTASNQDGRSNGLTAPNAAAQEQVIRAALADGGVSPAEVGFVECHGTGTTLGDPIEIGALHSVFGSDRSADRPLLVQSVKTNIGHLEGAAGIAGLCKLVLVIERARLPVHLHLTEPNPYIPWRDIAVEAVSGPVSWEVGAGERRIGGVSSFGFSGTNVHMVLEEAPTPQAGAPASAPSGVARVYAVSARVPEGLERVADAHAEGLRALAEGDWAAASALAMTGRAHLEERLAVVAGSAAEAAELLAAPTDAASPDIVRGRRVGGIDDGIVMLFTGQGSQRPGMGAVLYESEPTFRSAIDECASVLEDICGYDLRDAMFGDGAVAIGETVNAQPCLFAYEVALAALWRSWGVEPAAVAGHSIGEFAAAHVAGVMSLRDALRLVEARGRLMQALPRDGGMAAVLASEDVVLDRIAAWADDLSIAAVNGPRNVVVSGRRGPLDEVVAGFEADGFRVVPLEVSHAFHSSLMDPMLDEFELLVATVDLSEPELELISNRTGEVAEPGLLTSAKYWREHVRDTVRFEASMRHAVEIGFRVFLELGPSATLTGMAKAADLPSDCVFIGPVVRHDDECRAVQRALAAAHVAGAPVDWRAYAAIESGVPRPWVRLPTYPFEQRHYRLKAVAEGLRPGSRPRAADDGALIGGELRSPDLTRRVFESRLSAERPAWLGDHVLYGSPIVPATAYLALMRLAGEACNVEADVVHVQIERALGLSGTVDVQTIIDDHVEPPTVEIWSREDDEWHRHAIGQLAPALSVTDRSETEAASERCSDRVDGGEYYSALERVGVEYGPAFRLIDNAVRTDGEVLATIRDPGLAGAGDIHPALLDACLQALGLAMPGADDLSRADGVVYVPVAVGRWHVAGRLDGSILQAHGRAQPADEGSDVYVGELDLRDATGRLVARLEGIRFQRASGSSLTATRRDSDLFYATHWVPGTLEVGTDLQLTGRWAVIGSSALAVAIAGRIGSAGAVVAHREELSDGSDDLVVGEADFDGIVWVADGDGGPASAGPYALGKLLADLDRLAASTVVTVVTCRAMAVAPGDRVDGYESADLQGVVRVALAEYPQRFHRLIDVDVDPSSDVVDDATIDMVCSELVSGSHDEPEVAVRGGVRYVHRLARAADVEGLRLPDGDYVLDTTERGRLDALVLAPLPDLSPGPGEVLISVRATGLNFRDVLTALDQYAGEASSLGGECAGIVLAVGEGVDRVAPGDRVMAVAVASFASRCVVPAEMVTRQPAGWTHAQAATAPITFLTADYALRHLGRMCAGDRVLIHAAAGGVGMAAVQLAQQAGADIYATAGSEAKRAVLRAAGIRHVYDSRSTDFADEIMRDTEGAGVDLVLNSLTGDAIGASISVLASNGRFMEIGMAGIWEADRFRDARPDAEYEVIYLGQACVDRPDLIAARFDALRDEFERGTLRPLPMTVFDIRHSTDAFRFMAQARQIGKIVITASVGWNVGDAGGTWIISGGLGGLGIAVAEMLARDGASRLVLCGRRSPTSSALATIGALRAAGTDVRVATVDIADSDAVRTLVDDIVADGTPLTGVVHAAGLLDDAMLRDLGEEQYDRVLRPKVEGARSLLAACDPHDPDHVILFSAGAAVLGAPGQANYAAANAWLDALAHRRRALGLPAQSIDWGPWRTVGMAARLGEDALRRWESQGIVALDPSEGTRALRAAVLDGAPQVAIMRLRWSSLLHFFSKHRVPPLLRDLVRVDRRSATVDQPADLVTELGALTFDQRRQRVGDEVRGVLLQVLGLDQSFPVDPRDSLISLGLDSLMAVDLATALSRRFAVALDSRAVFEEPSVDALAANVLAAMPTSDLAAVGAPDGPGGVSAPAVDGDAFETAVATSPASPTGLWTGLVPPTGPDEQGGLIPIDSRSGPLPVSPAQERLLFLEAFQPGLALHNLPVVFSIAGPFDVRAWEVALSELVRRHESLRTDYDLVAGAYVQLVAPPVPLRVRYEDLRSTPAAALDDTIDVMVAGETTAPFDLRDGLKLRAAVLRVADERYIAVLTMHHIASDGWSVIRAMAEICELYRASTSGTVPDLRELPIQYVDYAAWQRRQLSRPELGEQLDYWIDHLAGELPVLDLPTDRPRRNPRSFDADVLTFELPADLVASVRAYSRATGATPFMTLLASYAATLCRYSGQQDVIIGTASANRQHAELHDLIGLFVNTLALRVRVDPAGSFDDLVAHVRQVALDANRNQDVPFDRVVEAVHPKRDVTRSALYQTMFLLHNMKPVDIELPGLDVEYLPYSTGTLDVDVSVDLVDPGTLAADAEFAPLEGSLRYNVVLFDRATMEGLLQHWLMLLRSVVTAPSGEVGAVDLFAADEVETVAGWNATAVQFAEDGLRLEEMFAAQVQRSPESVAVATADGGSLSFRELDERSNRLAHRLRGVGVMPGDIVGVGVERSAAMIEALLGVLKAGAAYLPLDPAFPEHRLSFMTADAGVSVLITSGTTLAERVAGTSDSPSETLTVIDLLADSTLLETEPATPLRSTGVDDSSLAYVIYTSGSTGAPKGVAIEHRNVVNLLSAMRERPGLRSEDVLLAVTTLSFDISVLEIFLPLVTGARLVIAGDEDVVDGVRLARLIESSGATVMQATPTTWSMLIEAGWEGSRTLRVLCGGEELSRYLAERLGARCAELWNMFGPTETTIWSTVQRVDPAGSGPVAIGAPIANTICRILDGRGQRQPIGVPGELYIGGAGVARGYLGRPELTGERFVPDHFCQEPGARLYRTGDLARWRFDGTIEYLGRRDHQVKVRGHRIELGEIEAALRELDRVDEAVVIVREDQPGDQRIVAYVIAADPGNSVEGPDIRVALAGVLPDYMVPSAYVRLDAFPETPNRKIDRNALPKPGASVSMAEHVAPRTDLERVVAKMIASALSVEQVGILDNFFDLGGHSMLATSLAARIRDVFGVDLELRSFFAEPTVEALCAALTDDPGQRTRLERIAGVELEVASLSADEVAQRLADMRRARTDGPAS